MNDSKLKVEILSKAEEKTTPTIEKLLDSNYNYHKNNLNVSDISFKSVKVSPPENSQSIGVVEVLVGLAGNIVASYIYEFLKDFINKKKKKIKTEEETIIIETYEFLIYIKSDTLGTDEMMKFIEDK